MTTRKEEKGQLPLSDPTDPPPLTTTRHHPSYSELDYGDHRHTLSFVGLHSLPPGTNADRRKHRHHRHRRNGGSTKEDPTGNKPVTPPSARVQFILGSEFTEDENYQNQHESHPVFSEMEELVLEPSGEFEWKETARWVRYEEDVEKGGQRWSKPHVATLSLHSLFELRSLLLNNIVMLDMEAATLDQIADLILDNTMSSGQLPPEARDKVREALLRRHRHLHEAKVREGKDKQGGARGLPIIRSLAEIGRITSGSRSVPAIPSAPSELTSYSSFSGLRPNSSASNLEQDVPKGNVHFMRKIPPGAEASNILIGEVDFLEKPLSAFVRLGQAVFLGDLTEVPVPTRFLFVLLGPMGGISKYHEVGRAMATLMSDEVFHDVAYKAKNRGHLLAGVDEFLDAVTVLPPGEWDPSIRIEPPNQVPSQDPRKRAHAPGQPGQPPTEPLDEDKEVAGPVDEELLEEKLREESGLTRTGRLFGGLMNDVRRKAPWYWSDFRDSLSVQCVASWIFLYFACLTPIITFGGLLGKETGGHMAAIESLVSGFVCGLIYGLFSGQPLTILGSTGPVLVFEKIMVGFCESNALGYLEFRLWIGIWISVILIVLVALDASAFVCYITRFTEENFATLIAFIFMYESFVNVLDIRKAFPVNPGFNNTAASLNCFCEVDGEDLSTVPFQQCGPLYNGTLTGAGCGYKPDVFLMSVLLFVGTFLISVLLKDFKNSSFFPANIRSTISDFAVIIAILAMSSTDYVMHLMTPKLEVPSQFKPTRDDRGWLIDPFGKNPAWSALAAVLPALLACILIFMDQQITAVIINRKEHKLKKGCGYHLDLFVLAILILICSFLGIPWFVAATVLSMNHVNSLRMESETAAPGEKPQFLGVREQRVTHVLIFLMIGLSVLLTPVLRLIPMPVLYGVFLYMGFASLKGMQFFDRILIIFMPEKYQPDHMFLRQVPLLRVHLFTLIQLTCLILLWLIKSFQKTRILFPVMLVVMIIVRKLLDYVFTQRELKILDDIMPEASRKKHEEKVKGGEEGTAGPGQPPLGPGKLTMGPSGQNLQIPLPNGNVMKIPLSNVNITEEVNRSGVWKSVNRGGEEKKGKGRKKERKEVATEEERRRLSTMEEEEDPAPPHIKICPSSPSQRSNRSTPV